MKHWVKKISLGILACLLLAQTALAAAAGAVTGVRFSQRAEAVRIVFDLEKLPAYTIRTENEGMRLIVDFPATVDKTRLKKLDIKDDLVKSVTFSLPQADTFRVTIDLSGSAVYKVNTLKNPNRFYIDLIKYYDQKFMKEIAPGLRQITVRRSNEKGTLEAHVLDVDLNSGYRLQPVLANDKIAGREALSATAKRHQALGGINASYFGLDGSIIGVTKIDSTVVSTTYRARSAFGLRGIEPLIGEVEYNGTATLPNGTVLPISAVNEERGENGLVIYNSYFDASTKTNPYGMEYLIADGKIQSIQAADTPLNDHSVVLSAHGTAMQKMAGLKVGDAVAVQEDLGKQWNEAEQIMGVGPMLVKDGSVYLTTKREAFGGDVAGGKAPRTAVGITADRHVLLVVADGRQSRSMGCTLLEMALFMQELGAVQAVNFDGGGSSEMVVQNEIVSHPSDGGERKIGSSLLIVPK